MSFEYKLPDVGEGLTEAEIVSWRVKEGDVVAINDVVVEIGDETKVNVHMTRRGIAAVLPPEDDTAPETIDADAEEEPDDDESAVTTREEAVTSEADAEAAAADHR